MAKVISVTNQKGGVGKTTTSLALVCGLSRKGYRVLAVDMDPQANLSFSLGGERDEGPTIYDLIKGEVSAECAVQKTEYADLIASNILASSVELEFTHSGREFLLKTALHPLQQHYDYIVIDTPPALSVLTVNAFSASDYLVIPMQADIFSLQGIAQLSDTIYRLKEHCNPDLIIGGILLCRYDKRTILGRRIYETAQMVAQEIGARIYKSTIRSSIAIQEAQTNQVSMFQYAPGSAGVRDYMNFVRELLDEGV